MPLIVDWKTCTMQPSENSPPVPSVLSSIVLTGVFVGSAVWLPASILGCALLAIEGIAAATAFTFAVAALSALTQRPMGCHFLSAFLVNLGVWLGRPYADMGGGYLGAMMAALIGGLLPIPERWIQSAPFLSRRRWRTPILCLIGLGSAWVWSATLDAFSAMEL